ncbi:MAG: hypothetical protein JSV64_01945 [Candidatus Bathyarchaeota archaeon]|nr:MAG: hypothetical protein JSV64_01945 [Candidatus Bathyarchaeota archaeon]
MPYYWTWLKIDRSKAVDALKGLKKLPKKSPNPGVKVYYVANVFGDWDNCVWFEADDNNHAMEYVQRTLSKIPGVTYTCTYSTAPIREYWKNWK